MNNYMMAAATIAEATGADYCDTLESLCLQIDTSDIDAETGAEETGETKQETTKQESRNWHKVTCKQIATVERCIVVDGKQTTMQVPVFESYAQAYTRELAERAEARERERAERKRAKREQRKRERDARKAIAELGAEEITEVTDTERAELFAVLGIQ